MKIPRGLLEDCFNKLCDTRELDSETGCQDKAWRADLERLIDELGAVLDRDAEAQRASA